MEHIPDLLSEGSTEEKVPAVILFHGFTGDKLEPHRMFLKISRALEAKGISSFRFDFSGSGESDGNFEDMTVSNEIAEAKRILEYVQSHERIDQTRISLLGLSLGGMIAGTVAGDLPDEIQRLVLLAPAGNMSEIVANMVRQVGADMSMPYFDRAGDLVGRNFAIDIQAIDGFTRAKRFQKPVLLIHGTNDMTIPYTVSLRYRDEVYNENASVHLIEGADHTFNGHTWESEVIETVTAFLTA